MSFLSLSDWMLMKLNIYCKGTKNIHFLIDYKAVIYSSFIYGIMTHIDQK